MTPNVFFISDTHFGHKGLVDGRLARADGHPARPFSSVEEMDETMVYRWNSLVRPEDKVYHLGDVAMSVKGLPILDRLNGRKTLILGNHDIYNTKEYLRYFKNVRATRVFDGFICSHVPVHPDSLARFRVNVHGHLHDQNLRDLRYINVCVEQTGYHPVGLETIQKWAKEAQ